MLLNILDLSNELLFQVCLFLTSKEMSKIALVCNQLADIVREIHKLSLGKDVLSKYFYFDRQFCKNDFPNADETQDDQLMHELFVCNVGSKWRFVQIHHLAEIQIKIVCKTHFSKQFKLVSCITVDSCFRMVFHYSINDQKLLFHFGHLNGNFRRSVGYGIVDLYLFQLESFAIFKKNLFECPSCKTTPFSNLTLPITTQISLPNGKLLNILETRLTIEYHVDDIKLFTLKTKYKRHHIFLQKIGVLFIFEDQEATVIDMQNIENKNINVGGDIHELHYLECRHFFSHRWATEFLTIDPSFPNSMFFVTGNIFTKYWFCLEKTQGDRWNLKYHGAKKTNYFPIFCSFQKCLFWIKV